jgi:hypothetical protein
LRQRLSHSRSSYVFSLAVPASTLSLLDEDRRRFVAAVAKPDLPVHGVACFERLLSI